MRECISVHVGQAGVQIGNSCWELFCLEHGIQPDGQMLRDMSAGDGVADETYDDYHSTFFRESSRGKYTARALMVDMEPSIVNKVKTGPLRQMFPDGQLITGREDTAFNFAQCFYSTGFSIINQVKEELRKMAEECDHLKGILVFNSMGGGTGSGLTSMLMETVSCDYPHKTKMLFEVYPSPRVASAVTEPYNAVFLTEKARIHTDVEYLFDNESVYNICHKKLGVEDPNFTHINLVIAQVVSSIVASYRFDGVCSRNFQQIGRMMTQTTKSSYPRVHHPTVSYMPLPPTDSNKLSVTELTQECLSAGNKMMNFEAPESKYLSCCVLYRGDVLVREVDEAIKSIIEQRTARFKLWGNARIRVGINRQMPTMLPGSGMGKPTRAVCMLGHTTAIVGAFERLATKFDIMFEKKAFLHYYYREGMYDHTFKAARESVRDIVAEYRRYM